MGYQRARSTEQKKERLNQILNATSELFDEYAFKDITLEMIASKLDFSRANMARYVSSKEEIFILLFMKDLKAFTNELLIQSEANNEINIDDFVSHFCSVLIKYPHYLRISPILNTVIETNIKADKLAIYKKEIFVQTDILSKTLITYFPFLSIEESFSFVMMINDYINGLYPSSHWTDLQKEALKIAGLDFKERDFEENLFLFIKLTLSGFLHMKQQ